MTTRTTISALILMLALGLSVFAQSQTPKNNEPATKDKDKSQPVITKQPKPQEPAKYQGPPTHVTIVLKCIFRSSGKVTDIRLVEVKSDGSEGISEELGEELTNRSIKAARAITFKPATKDGHNVSMYMQLEYTFDLTQLAR